MEQQTQGNKIILQMLTELQELTELQQKHLQLHQDLAKLHQQTNQKIDDLRQRLIQQATLNIPTETENGRDSQKKEIQLPTKAPEVQRENTKEQEINRNRESFGRTVLHDKRVPQSQYSAPRRPARPTYTATVGFPRRKDFTNETRK